MKLSKSIQNANEKSKQIIQEEKAFIQEKVYQYEERLTSQNKKLSSAEFHFKVSQEKIKEFQKKLYDYFLKIKSKGEKTVRLVYFGKEYTVNTTCWTIPHGPNQFTINNEDGDPCFHSDHITEMEFIK